MVSAEIESGLQSIEPSARVRALEALTNTAQTKLNDNGDKTCSSSEDQLRELLSVMCIRDWSSRVRLAAVSNPKCPTSALRHVLLSDISGIVRHAAAGALATRADCDVKDVQSALLASARAECEPARIAERCELLSASFADAKEFAQNTLAEHYAPCVRAAAAKLVPFRMRIVLAADADKDVREAATLALEESCEEETVLGICETNALVWVIANNAQDEMWNENLMNRVSFKSFKAFVKCVEEFEREMKIMAEKRDERAVKRICTALDCVVKKHLHFARALDIGRECSDRLVPFLDMTQSE